MFNQKTYAHKILKKIAIELYHDRTEFRLDFPRTHKYYKAILQAFISSIRPSPQPYCTFVGILILGG